MATPATVISFRHLLTGAIDDFLAEQGMASPATAGALAELVVVLSHYREEGTALHPLVFLCERLDALMAHVEASDALVLGEGDESPETVRLAIKTCAPLAQGGWSAFLDRQGETLRFGVFRTDDFVLRETPLQVLRRTHDPSLRAVAIVRVAEDVVELRGGVGPSRHVYLSGARTEALPPGVVSQELLASVTRDSDERVRADLFTFYRRVMLDVVRAAHGTLVAVVPAGPRAGRPFRDGVFLPSPVDVGAAIAAHQASRGAATQASLQGLRALLRGMMASDGVTVLRTDGAVVGFNVFVEHAPAPEGGRAPVPGGARRRTFETLAGMLGRGLDAAFYRSQDGHTECRRVGGDGDVNVVRRP